MTSFGGLKVSEIQYSIFNIQRSTRMAVLGLPKTILDHLYRRNCLMSNMKAGAQICLSIDQSSGGPTFDGFPQIPQRQAPCARKVERLRCKGFKGRPRTRQCTSMIEYFGVLVRIVLYRGIARRLNWMR
jgi:hypothetical protein